MGLGRFFLFAALPVKIGCYFEYSHAYADREDDQTRKAVWEMLNGIWAGMILLAVIYGAATGHMAEVTNAALDSAGEAISLCFTMAGVVALWMGLMEIAGKAGLVEKLTVGIRPFLRFLFPRIPEGHPAQGYIATNIIANVLGLGWACTPAGLKAMEELAKLETERGNPEYLEAEYGVRDAPGAGNSRRGDTRRDRETREQIYMQTAAGRNLKGSRAGESFRRQENAGRGDRGKGAGRRASNEMCIFLILNISSLQLIPVNMIAYRSQYGSANPTAIIAPAIVATLVSTLVAIVYCKIKDYSARIGMGRSRMNGCSMDQNNKGSRADLKAGEIGGISHMSVGFPNNDTDAGIVLKRRKGRGGKAV